MATSQMHGKSFENAVKSANGIFSYATADRKRTPNSRFDIAAEDDKERGIPTSIKSTGSDSVSLSDARRFWESFNFAPYRMLIGKYHQENDKKIYGEIHEFILREKYRSALLGEVTQSEIEDFHNGLKNFGKGQHLEAREWHRKQNQDLSERLGIVYLNPKVDSKTQRRLQCSVSLSELMRVVDSRDHTVHSERFGTIPLPYETISKRRFS